MVIGQRIQGDGNYMSNCIVCCAPLRIDDYYFGKGSLCLTCRDKDQVTSATDSVDGTAIPKPSPELGELEQIKTWNAVGGGLTKPVANRLLAIVEELSLKNHRLEAELTDLTVTKIALDIDVRDLKEELDLSVQLRDNVEDELEAELKEWKSRAMASPCKCTDYEIRDGHMDVCEYGKVLRKSEELQKENEELKERLSEAAEKTNYGCTTRGYVTMSAVHYDKMEAEIRSLQERLKVAEVVIDEARRSLPYINSMARTDGLTEALRLYDSAPAQER